MSYLLADAVSLFRGLWKAKAFSLSVLITLTLSISLSATVSDATYEIIGRPLPFAHADGLTLLCRMTLGAADCSQQIDSAAIGELERSLRTVGSVAAFQYNRATLTSRARPKAVLEALVSQSFFSALEIHPALGRFFVSSDGDDGNNVMVISTKLWQAAFNGSPEALGTTVRLDGVPWTIVGVAPPFAIPEPRGSLENTAAEVFVPLRNKTFSAGASAGADWALLRLHHYANFGTASAELAQAISAITSSNPAQYRNLRLTLTALSDWYFRDTRSLLIVVLLCVLAIQLIAFGNIANLILERGLHRSQEHAIRIALGATKLRATQRMLTELLCLGMLSALFALLMSVIELDMLSHFHPSLMPRSDDLGFNSVAFVVTLASLAACMLFAGVIPIAISDTANLSTRLRSSSGSSVNGLMWWARSSLVAIEVGLAFTVLSCSALFLRNYFVASSTQLGFDPNRVYRGDVLFVAKQYAKPEREDAFVSDMLTKVQNVSGVSDAALARPMAYSRNGTELNGTFQFAAHVEANSNTPSATITQVTPSYFHALHIALLLGRTFNNADRLGNERVCIVEERFRKAYFGSTSPIGRELLFPGLDQGQTLPVRVVGVVGSVAQKDPLLPPIIYVPFFQAPSQFADLVIKMRVDDSQTFTKLLGAIDSVDDQQALADFESLTSYLWLLNEPAMTSAVLITTFALIAAVLSGVGLFSISLYTTARCKRSFAIRKALGATPTSLLMSALMPTSMQTMSGLALGFAAMHLIYGRIAPIVSSVPLFDLRSALMIASIVIMSTLAASAIPILSVITAPTASSLRYE